MCEHPGEGGERGGGFLVYIVVSGVNGGCMWYICVCSGERGEESV